MNRKLLIIGAAAIALALIPARPWIALAYHASSYPITAAGEAANVVIHDSTAFVSRAEDGFEVVDASSGRHLATVPPAEGNESVDDLAVADGFLFALDARPPGHLTIFALEDDPARPRLVSGPVDVAVGPFSGVSAGGGRVIVSGGTSLLTLLSYDANGLSAVLATADFGRGQPDVLIDAAGRRAVVSTHRWGPYFGFITARLTDRTPFLEKAGGGDLDTYGFTPGGAKPANFPIEAALDGDTLLVASGQGLSVVSIASLDQPRLLANVELAVKPVNVDVRGAVAAVVGSSPQPLLILLDISAPSSPRAVRSIPLPRGSRPTGVAIGATHVLVAAGRAGSLSVPL